ncbi:MAG: hypothetical protein A3G75_13175 [Verrucomicrobia bacterium RIFCSPLOWO2_12_FULL_64_8]|nr:MAG: hypothetical protein A3G75_13175 [Verrucomicrobia bacterium RIFCSPLOWO2_12_FULL_64_8]
MPTGSSRAEALAALGAPRGEARSGDRTFLYYERGVVELRLDRVVRASLISEEVYDQRVAQRLAEAERLKAESELRLAGLTAEGEALRARKLADPVFNAAPLSYQVAFWEDFARRYPGVPSAEQLILARLRLTDELERRRIEEDREDRLAELEARVAAAEARARDAETRTYPFGGFYSYYGRSRHSTPFSLWPVEYHFGDATTMEPPARSPGLMPGSLREPPARSPGLMPGTLREPPARSPGLMPGSLREPPARSPGLMPGSLRTGRTRASVRPDRDDCGNPRGRHPGSHQRRRSTSRI